MINYKVSVEREIAIAHQLTHHEGKCKLLHGHNLDITVVIHANKLLKDGSSAGMLVDFGTVKKIIDRYDHTYLNESLKQAGAPVSTFEQPTAEKFATFLVETIQDELENKSLTYISVKVQEAKGQFAEVEWREDV